MSRIRYFSRATLDVTPRFCTGSVVHVFLGLALFACGGDSEPGETADASDVSVDALDTGDGSTHDVAHDVDDLDVPELPPRPPPPDPIAYRSSSGTIGPEGGEIDLGEGVIFRVPAGALAETVTINAEMRGLDTHDQRMLYFAFEPAGLEFAIPAVIDLAVPEHVGVEPAVVAGSWSDSTELIDAGSELHRLVPADLVELDPGHVGVEVPHFTFVFVYLQVPTWLDIVLDIPPAYLLPGDTLFTLTQYQTTLPNWHPGHVGVFAGGRTQCREPASGRIIEAGGSGGTIAYSQLEDREVVEFDELTGQEVRSTIQGFKTAHRHFYLGAFRPLDGLTPAQRSTMMEFLSLQIDKPYDYIFSDWSTASYSCVSLAETALDQVGMGVIPALNELAISAPLEMYALMDPVHDITAYVGEEIVLPVYAAIVHPSAPGFATRLRGGYCAKQPCCDGDSCNPYEIGARYVPRGATFREETPGVWVFRWTPTAEQLGEKIVFFDATASPSVRGILDGRQELGEQSDSDYLRIQVVPCDDPWTGTDPDAGNDAAGDANDAASDAEGDATSDATDAADAAETSPRPWRVTISHLQSSGSSGTVFVRSVLGDFRAECPFPGPCELPLTSEDDELLLFEAQPDPGSVLHAWRVTPEFTVVSGCRATDNLLCEVATDGDDVRILATWHAAPPSYYGEILSGLLRAVRPFGNTLLAVPPQDGSRVLNALHIAEPAERGITVNRAPSGAMTSWYLDATDDTFRSSAGPATLNFRVHYATPSAGTDPQASGTWNAETERYEWEQLEAPQFTAWDNPYWRAYWWGDGLVTVSLPFGFTPPPYQLFAELDALDSVLRFPTGTDAWAVVRVLLEGDEGTESAYEWRAPLADFPVVDEEYQVPLLSAAQQSELAALGREPTAYMVGMQACSPVSLFGITDFPVCFGTYYRLTPDQLVREPLAGPCGPAVDSSGVTSERAIIGTAENNRICDIQAATDHPVGANRFRFATESPETYGMSVLGLYNLSDVHAPIRSTTHGVVGGNPVFGYSVGAIPLGVDVTVVIGTGTIYPGEPDISLTFRRDGTVYSVQDYSLVDAP